MDQRSFKDILLEKLGGTERFHSQNPVDLDPVGLSYLLGQVEKFSFSQTFGTQSQYKKPASRPKYKLEAPRAKGPAHELNDSQKAAYAFFRANGSPLLEDYTLAELKTGFRSLAFKLHPDCGGSSATFIELKKSYELLSEVLK
jgi:hypothetical protein